MAADCRASSGSWPTRASSQEPDAACRNPDQLSRSSLGRSSRNFPVRPIERLGAVHAAAACILLLRACLSPRFMRHRLLPALDLLAIVLALVGAFMLRLDGAFLHTPGLQLACAICVGAALVIKPLLFIAGGLYRRYWPYAGA